MQPIPETPARFRLRVLLKLTTLLAAGVVLSVVVQYVGSDNERGGGGAVVTQVEVDGLAPDHARRAEFDGTGVWILRRSEATRSALAAGAASADAEWLVVHDRGPRNGCPLVWRRDASDFRETCSGARYDAAGAPTGETPGPPLQRVPYQVDDGARALILGE